MIAASRRGPALAAALILCLLPLALPAAGAGDRAPTFTLADPDGVAIEFPAAAGSSPSVLLFWATWCPYCKAVMPYLDGIARRYADRDVTIFAVNIKEDGDPRAFAADSGYLFRWLLDGDAVAESYGVRYTPGILVVDGGGTIVYRRESTDMPPGRKVAEYWAERIEAALDLSLARR